MIKCTVEFYGLSAETSGNQGVELTLEDGAGLPELIKALVKEVPALDGIISREGTGLLSDALILNVGGRFYHNEDNLILKEGDVVRILMKAIGG